MLFRRFGRYSLLKSLKCLRKLIFESFLQVMKAAAMSHRMIEFPVSSGNSHRVKESTVKEVIEPIPDTKPKYLEIEKEDFTGMKKLEIKAKLYIRHTPAKDRQ